MRFVVFLFLAFAVLGAADVNWMSLDSARSIAKEQNKLIMIEVSAHGCKYCVEMANTTLKNEATVAKINKHFASVLFYADSDKIPKEFLSRGTPTFYFLDKTGKRLTSPIFGAWNTADFDSFLEAAIKRRDGAL